MGSYDCRMLEVDLDRIAKGEEWFEILMVKGALYRITTSICSFRH